MDEWIGWLIFFGIIALIVLVGIIKSKFWDAPRREIEQLNRELDKKAFELNSVESTIIQLNKDLNKSYKELDQSKETIDDLLTNNRNLRWQLERKIIINNNCVSSLESYKKEIDSLQEQRQKEIDNLQSSQMGLFKEIQVLKGSVRILREDNKQFKANVAKLLKTVDDVDYSSYSADQLLQLLIERYNFTEKTNSNLKAIPYMAAIMADYETIGLKELANRLNWGTSQERAKKVTSLVTLRKETKELLSAYKEAQYQLEYLLNLFPNLRDIIDSEFGELPKLNTENIEDYDTARDYLSKEEYLKLSTAERNQLALDRYRESHRKSKWQIGRDYEMYVGYKYSQKGYIVDYFGSFMGIEDLGRDLICKKEDNILIIQCKYWSQIKEIHENHINQLYGTTISYCIENNIDKEFVKGVLVTNISLSATAKKMASYLGIEYIENYALGEYPCIKCNIGIEGKIYHLPFDQQYDSTKIDKPGEFYAMTVVEAERKGFRRAFKWFGGA